MTSPSLHRRVACIALILLATALPVVAAGAGNTSAPDLIPMPASMQVQGGRYLAGKSVRVNAWNGDTELTELGELGAQILTDAWGLPLAPPPAATHGHAELTLRLQPDANANTRSEAYTLQVDDTGIAISAPNTAGLFLGLQTLRQLLAQPTKGQPPGIDHVLINDSPRFSWRGLHLDVGRHMFPVEHIKRQLDLMARYKFNVLHWHLTDDQGWRLQIQRYPRLTDISAWRKRTPLYQRDGSITYDDSRYGGFYTQDEARDIVAYAKKLHITVVPEIEMPGHAVAALAAYPELGCTAGPFEVWTNWGVSDEVFCPSEKTFTFLQNVLDEVMAIFPSQYIHAGGDEAPTVRWQQSTLAQQIIRREGLTDEHALQGWFMRRIEKYLQQHGRRMLAWDEMLAGNPAPSTTIMAWRSSDEGAKAARLGHDVVMTPTSYSYFDYCQSRSPDEPYCPGYLPIEKVYDFEPVPAQLSPAQARHVLGGQANLWTEHIRTPQAAEYMLWPRALAMSEVLWSPARNRNWQGFLQRLGPQLAELGRLKVNYRVPEVVGIDGDVLSLGKQATIALHSPLADARIVYTIDGSQPDADSPRYNAPVILTLGKAPAVISARLLTADGRLGPVMRARYARTTLQPPQHHAADNLQAGLVREYFEAPFDKTDTLISATPLRSSIVDTIDLPSDARAEGFGLRYRGWLQIPASGVYRFSLVSDDGARLFLDDKLLIDRDGPQSPGRSYGSVGLGEGLHRFELRYFQGGGDKALQLQVSRDGQPATDIPAAWWRRQSQQ